MNDNAAIHLRPSSIGELLDQAIAIYRRNFVTFVGIFAVVMVPLILAQTLFSLLTLGDWLTQFQDPSSLPDNPFEIFTPGYALGMMGNSAVSILNFVLVQGLATAAITRALGDVYLGRPITIRDAYRRVGSSWLNLLGGLLLGVVFAALLGFWIIIPCVGWLTGPGMLAFLGMALIPMLAPVIILERQPVAQAFHRVWDLCRRRFWPVLVYVFILALFGQLVVTGPTAVVTLVFQFVINNPLNPMMGIMDPSTFVVQTIIQSLVTLTTTLVFLPLQISCMILLYFDLRIRTEGFDLAARLRQQQDGDLDALFAQSPRPVRPAMPDQQEWVYFSSISLLVVLIVGLFFTLFMALVFLIAALTVGSM